MIKVVELFAGVGGFRLGLEGHPRTKNSKFKVIWSNQWEPSTKAQHANWVYRKNWHKANHSEENISTIRTKDIPEHDLLVGGFPCQDYSVATTLKSSEGLQGKKGVLWWEIYRILEEKKSKRPPYLLLENVDRLLKSPATQRGRDFAVMLASLDKLGYAIEWRVVNAAEYGMPQRRRRVFICAYHRSTDLYKEAIACKDNMKWIVKESVLGAAFPSQPVDPLWEKYTEGDLDKDVVEISKNFNKGKKMSPFENSGFAAKGKFWTIKTTPKFKGKQAILKDIILPLKKVPQEFRVDEDSLDKWAYLKGPKDEERYNKKGGYSYRYNEGGMIFPDNLNKPSRTIITGEGGPSPSRFKHVVKQNGKLRRLMPVELEKLNGFPADWTKMEGVSDAKRAFFMGNALVVGVVKRIGKELSRRIGR
ncbi:DNA (cytosine-5-)-methyltransferase [Planctomycetota bacterium]|nr:DNA (cytosine-5-)-methyltransferase [Planctomycetota bacterium]